MKRNLHLAWIPDGFNGHITIDGEGLPAPLRVWYIELYMRPGSHTQYPGAVIRHTTTLVAADRNDLWLELRCKLDGDVVVNHRVSVNGDVVDFDVSASNLGNKRSDVAWGAPCVIVDEFTGLDRDSYLSKCFIFLDGKLSRLPVEPWAEEAIEKPGQVWCPEHVDRGDVEPHPLSELVPSNGLIGCFSKDESSIMATAWQPYQNLFQGIIACLHADFRIDGLEPAETKRLRGKIYVMAADVLSLLERYESDFPEHRQ